MVWVIPAAERNESQDYVLIQNLSTLGNVSELEGPGRLASPAFLIFRMRKVSLRPVVSCMVSILKEAEEPQVELPQSPIPNSVASEASGR